MKIVDIDTLKDSQVQLEAFVDETKNVCYNLNSKDQDLWDKLEKLEELKQKASRDIKLYLSDQNHNNCGDRMPLTLYDCKSRCANTLK
jgi:hypothetical protein